MPPLRIAVIGAGIAGLTAAVDLARAGCDVLVCERAATPGGKMREIRLSDGASDAGPSVFTLRRVFDELFADAGDSLERHVKLRPATLLARHAWNARDSLDLFADVERSRDAIGVFAGARAAQGFARFAADAARVYTTLDRPFMRGPRPSPLSLARRIGWRAMPDLWRIRPFDTLARAVGDYFDDPRLRQLFGRYATYCGSSPFASPATLMLVAHVEQAGVWYIDGGMYRLVEQLAALAGRQGARLRCDSEVRDIHLTRGRVSGIELADGERIAVDAVISNADNHALASGLFGRAVAHAVRPTPVAARSLSAVTFNLRAATSGFALAHHSVFFSDDYEAEFTDIFARRRVPLAPTIYVCAQDRVDARPLPPGQSERLFCLINAPAVGDVQPFDSREIAACETRLFERLNRYGLSLAETDSMRITTPAEFHRLFPATGGALYGPASHGWRASFLRPGSRSAVPGLYLAGGSTHPGPGVPMAATSGRLAAARLLADWDSTGRSRPAAMSGGISTR